MNSKTALLVSSIIAATLVGCKAQETEMSIECEKIRFPNEPVKDYEKCSGKVSIKFIVNPSKAIDSETSQAANVLDVRNYKLKISATNMLVTSTSGLVNLSVHDGLLKLDTKQFEYIKQGDFLLLNSPDSVNAWIEGFQGSADRVSYEFDDLQAKSPSIPGSNYSLTLTQYESGEAIGSSTKHMISGEIKTDTIEDPSI